MNLYIKGWVKNIKVSVTNQGHGVIVRIGQTKEFVLDAGQYFQEWVIQHGTQILTLMINAQDDVYISGPNDTFQVRLTRAKGPEVIKGPKGLKFLIV